jgi:hypothetical protein
MGLDNFTAIAKKGGGIFCIADLGCATGINTLVVTDTIIFSQDPGPLVRELAQSRSDTMLFFFI